MRKHAARMTDEEVDMGVIIGPLNDAPNRSDVRRVVAILDALSIVSKPPGKAEEAGAYMRLHKALGKYLWTQRVIPPYRDKGGPRVVTSMARAEGQAEQWERDAVSKLLELVPGMSGQPRIRRCGSGNCGRWFFASKRIDHTFCSGKCRQHEWDSDPGRRARKNASMRENRNREKEKIARGKLVVGFGGKSMPRSSQVAPIRSRETKSTA